MKTRQLSHMADEGGIDVFTNSKCVCCRDLLLVCFVPNFYRHVDSEMHTYDIATSLIALLPI